MTLSPTQKGGTQSLIGHTMYKAPTLSTAAGRATSALPLPKRQSEVLYMKKHTTDETDLSSISFVADKSGVAAKLYFQEVNSIPVNGLKNKNRQAKGTYAMACLLKSGDRDVVAIVTVEELISKAVGIDYVYITHSINGRLRKNSEGSLSSTRETGYGLTAAPSAATFDISIAEFLEIVNETHRSILSQDVLNHFNEERPSDGHYVDRILFSDRDTESVSNRSLLANAFEGIAQTEIEKQKIQEYRSKINLMNGQKQKLRKLNQEIKELSFAKGKRGFGILECLLLCVDGLEESPYGSAKDMNHKDSFLSPDELSIIKVADLLALVKKFDKKFS